MNSERSVLSFLWQLLVVIAAILLISCIITPPIYQFLADMMGESVWPYSRVFDRVIMVVAFVLIIVRRKHFVVSNFKSELQPFFTGNKTYPLIAGFLLSLLVSLSLIAFIVQGGTLVWEEITLSALFFRLLKVIPAALIISLIEEVFFRYFLFVSLRRYLSFFGAAFLSSALYGTLHFIQPVKSWTLDNPYSITSGFEYLLVLGERYLLPGILPASIGLFLVGFVLCVVVERTKSLLPCIGLHAGWVAATKLIGKLTERAAGFEYPAGAGSRYYLLTHEISWIAVILVGVISLFLFLPKRDSLEAVGEPA